MMTPKEVQEHGFNQARKGYDMAEVDEFLDALTEDYTALFTNYGKLSNSYAKLKKKAQALAQALEQTKNSRPAAPAPAPVQPVTPVVDTSATQSAADEILRAARKDAEAIRAGAQRERQQIIAEATGYAAENAERLKGEVAAEEARLASAKKAVADYVNQVKRVMNRQAALLDELPDAGAEESGDEVLTDSTFATVQETVESVEEPTRPLSSAADLASEISRRLSESNYSAEDSSDDLDETRVMPSPQEEEESLFDVLNGADQTGDLDSEFDEE